MSNTKWIFVLQLNAESDLEGSMQDVINTCFKNYVADSQFEFVILFDKSTPSTQNELGLPVLFYIKDNVPTLRQTLKNDNLSSADGIKNILNTVFDHYKNLDKKLVYILKDHGGGMDLLTNNMNYRHLDVHVENPNDDTPKALEERFKNHFPTFSLVSVYKMGTIYRILFGRSDANGIKYLTIAEIGKAIVDSQFKKAEILCIDSCWGQMFENVLTVKNSCNYYIANEDQGPIAGIGYDQLTKYLFSVRHRMTTPEIVNAITASYILMNQQDYLTDPDFEKMGVCLSAFRTSAIDNVLTLFNEICSKLFDLLGDQSKKEKSLQAIYKSRIECFDFLYEGPTPPVDGDYPVYVIDLIHFFSRLVENLKPEQNLNGLILKFIVLLYENLTVERNNYKEFDENSPTVIAKGISFFFPLTLGHWKKSEMYIQPTELNLDTGVLHKEIVRNTKWPELLKKILSLCNINQPNELDPKYKSLWDNYQSNSGWITLNFNDDFKKKYSVVFDIIKNSDEALFSDPINSDLSRYLEAVYPKFKE